VGQDYGAQQITVLEGLEPVRKRPGMYIGSTGARGLHHLVYEVVDNSVDEALAGHATAIEVELHADGRVTVQDDGRGIPCDLHVKTGRPALETVLTVLHAGGKFGGEDTGYKVSAGLHGVGISVVNALSERLDIEVARGGQRHTMAFAKGLVVGDMSTEPLIEGGGRTSGTAVTFLPDPSIFPSAGELSFETLATRFDEQAFLNAGLNITLVDWREMSGGDGDGDAPRVQECCHLGGLEEYVALICKEKTPLLQDTEQPSIVVRQERKDVVIDVALRWSSDQYNDQIVSFANGVHTPNGGTHVDGFKVAATSSSNPQPNPNPITARAPTPTLTPTRTLTPTLTPAATLNPEPPPPPQPPPQPLNPTPLRLPGGHHARAQRGGAERGQAHREAGEPAGRLPARGALRGALGAAARARVRGADQVAPGQPRGARHRLGGGGRGPRPADAAAAQGARRHHRQGHQRRQGRRGCQGRA